MFPSYPDFKSIDIEDLSLITKYLSKSKPEICEWAPANLSIWKDFDHPKITTVNNNLCILISPPSEEPYFLEPIGNNNLQSTLEICFKHVTKLSRVSENFIHEIDSSAFRIEELRSQFDYIYLRNSLAELKGKKFDGKRNHLKRFKVRFPDYKYVPLTLSHEKEAIKLFEQWFDIKKDTTYFSKLTYASQKKLIQNAFLYFKKLKISGGAIFNKDEMLGFILGSALNLETVTIHFQFGNPNSPGISQALLYEACNKTFTNYKFINLEQDLGIPGLRQSKLSYHPFKFGKKFEIRTI